MEDILRKVEELTVLHDIISPEMIKDKKIKIGLRNRDGSGVVAGVTTKGRVVGYKKITKGTEEKVLPVEGELFYCGYNIEKIIDEISTRKSFGFDEITYLLLTGELPTKDDLISFSDVITKRRALSKAERKVIMEEVQNDNQMYGLHSVISHLCRCDNNPDSLDLEDVCRQCINLIAKFPAIVAYNYNVMKFGQGADLKISRPRPELSTAENFLYMLRGTLPDKFESHLFDLALILHAEHGGGNNSTFSVRSVSSSGANTYMAIAAGIASLSGHLHGGANESVMKMMKKLKKAVKDWGNDNEIREYLKKLIDNKDGNTQERIYGLGHAVYTLSDPRAIILKKYAAEFAKLKGVYDEYLLFEKVEKIGTKLISDRKNIAVSANVDFYSGFVYKLLGIPKELYTPIFAMARVSGWASHRLEQIIQGKIMRPAYLPLDTEEKEFISLDKR